MRTTGICWKRHHENPELPAGCNTTGFRPACRWLAWLLWATTLPLWAQEVPVTERTLSNGIHVLLLERHNDPSVAEGWVARQPGGVYYAPPIPVYFQTKSHTVPYAISIAFKEMTRIAAGPVDDPDIDTAIDGMIDRVRAVTKPKSSASPNAC
jgi:hypothetical protein